MGEKYDLQKMLAEIREDEEFDGEKSENNLSQEQINRMILERIRKRKAKKQ